MFIDDILYKNKYLNFLNKNVQKSATKMGIQISFKFYQDSYPKHKALMIQEYLLYNCPKVLHPPPQSPDLNPIKNLWDELDNKIRKSTINSKIELKTRLKEEWDSISSKYLKKLLII